MLVYRINGNTPASSGLDGLQLRLINQDVDQLSFRETVDFDADGAFAQGASIELTRYDTSTTLSTTIFRGVVIGKKRRGDESREMITYTVAGAWYQLSRVAFLQKFKGPVDPEDPESALVDYWRGRTILGQADNGLKVELGAFIKTVVDYAAAQGAQVQSTAGSISLGVTVPWDEVTDLSCAEVIRRLLQWVPDAVAWWDYTQNPPNLLIRRRSALSAVNLVVASSGGAPFDSIDIRARHDLLADTVVLFYLATNRSNSSAWETVTPDADPITATGREPGAVVRTIRLAGSTYMSSTLRQQVEVDPLPALLGYPNTYTATVNPSEYNTLRTWWRKHVPELRDATITIKGFSDGSVVTDTGAPRDEDCTNELIAGSVTDWMVSNSAIKSEQQTATVTVDYEYGPIGKKQRTRTKFSVNFLATNAATKTYTSLASASYTPPEEIPTGLATVLKGALSELQYDGQFALVEQEVSGLCSVGQVVNLTGSRAEWATMRAVVQEVTFDYDSGSTQIGIGPAGHLGPTDLIEIYRSNRNRQPVTSEYIRTGGRRNPSEEQGLGLHHGRKSPSRARTAPGIYAQALSMSGVVPTNLEIQTALAAVYASSEPTSGDIIALLVTGSEKFRATVSYTNPGGAAPWTISFVVGSTTWYALLSQTGIL